jgi:hypothetical protein
LKTNSTNFNFYFDGKLIPLTSIHKHLGITFSEEAKWNKHVANLIKSVSKHICVLRKLKYKLNRKNLEKLYLIYKPREVSSANKRLKERSLSPISLM